MMDTGLAPTISFAGNTAAITSQGDGQWVDDDTWTETFNVGDADEETATVTVSTANAQDTADNVEGTPTVDTFVIDTRDPVVNITNPLSGMNVKADEVITFTIDESGSVECSIDDSNWYACTSGSTMKATSTSTMIMPC